MSSEAFSLTDYCTCNSQCIHEVNTPVDGNFNRYVPPKDQPSFLAFISAMNFALLEVGIT
jgi:hypothetical protein